MKSMVKTMIHFAFMSCVEFLIILGKAFRMDYEKISVVFNIYVQGGILLVSGLMPLCVMLYNIILEGISCSNILLTMLVISYGSMYLLGFMLLVRYYPRPDRKSFQLCVEELERLAHSCRMTYMEVNVLIFVIWWLSVVGINLAMSVMLFN